jgi:hypothetical protein
MPLTKSQKIILHQAKRQAVLDDTEYRDLLEHIGGPGVRSSTDPKLDNRHLDKILAFMEAIYWRKVDAGQVEHEFNPKHTFRNRGFWAQRNTAQETTRDRFNTAELAAAIQELEAEAPQMGNHPNYIDAIKWKVTNGQTDSNPFGSSKPHSNARSPPNRKKPHEQNHPCC